MSGVPNYERVVELIEVVLLAGRGVARLFACTHSMPGVVRCAAETRDSFEALVRALHSGESDAVVLSVREHSPSAHTLAAVLLSAIDDFKPLLPDRIAAAMCAVFYNQHGAGSSVQKMCVAMLPLLRKMDPSRRGVLARLCAMLKTTATDDAVALAASFVTLLLPTSRSKNVKIDVSRSALCAMMLDFPELLFYTDLAGKRQSNIADHADFVAMYTAPANGGGALHARSVSDATVGGRMSQRLQLLDDSVVEGALRKWHRAGQWNDRYFVLKPSHLTIKYYASSFEYAGGKPAKGGYLFDSESTVEEDAPHAREMYCFTLTASGGKKVLLSASTAESRGTWIAGLRATCARQRAISISGSAASGGVSGGSRASVIGADARNSISASPDALCLVQATQKRVSHKDGALSFAKGQVFELTAKQSTTRAGWWVGRTAAGATGEFPKACVVILPGTEPKPSEKVRRKTSGAAPPLPSRKSSADSATELEAEKAMHEAKANAAADIANVEGQAKADAQENAEKMAREETVIAEARATAAADRVAAKEAARIEAERAAAADAERQATAERVAAKEAARIEAERAAAAKADLQANARAAQREATVAEAETPPPPLTQCARHLDRRAIARGGRPTERSRAVDPPPAAHAARATLAERERKARPSTLKRALSAIDVGDASSAGSSRTPAHATAVEGTARSRARDRSPGGRATRSTLPTRERTPAKPAERSRAVDLSPAAHTTRATLAERERTARPSTLKRALSAIDVGDASSAGSSRTPAHATAVGATENGTRAPRAAIRFSLEPPRRTARTGAPTAASSRPAARASSLASERRADDVTQKIGIGPSGSNHVKILKKRAAKAAMSGVRFQEEERPDGGRARAQGTFLSAQEVDGLTEEGVIWAEKMKVSDNVHLKELMEKEEEHNNIVRDLRADLREEKTVAMEHVLLYETLKGKYDAMEDGIEVRREPPPPLPHTHRRSLAGATLPDALTHATLHRHPPPASPHTLARRRLRSVSTRRRRRCTSAAASSRKRRRVSRRSKMSCTVSACAWRPIWRSTPRGSRGTKWHGCDRSCDEWRTTRWLRASLASSASHRTSTRRRRRASLKCLRSGSPPRSPRSAARTASWTKRSRGRSESGTS
jgi:hypothetical protein